MFLIIFGIIVLIAGLAVRRMEKVSPFARVIRIAGFVLILIGVITACFVQVDAGQIGVKKLFGKVSNEALESGLHFINPLYEVEKLDIKTQNYTMSGVHDEGNKSGDDAIRVLTADGLEV